MLIGRLYIQLGVTVDFMTGEHEPSLSAALREALGSQKQNVRESGGSSEFDAVNEQLKQHIPPQHLPLFPQFGVTTDWPPTYLAHGSLDSAVHVNESQHLYRLLQDAGVDARLNVIEGKEHSFDYEDDAEALHGEGLFDDVVQFMIGHLEGARKSVP